MRGGTSFEPLAHQRKPGPISFMGLPRTQTESSCDGKAVYRPELVILTTDGTDYYADYASEILDFGTSLLDEKAREDVCGGSDSDTSPHCEDGCWK